MEAKTVSLQTKAIQNRFFEAINILIAGGKIAGLRTFCLNYDLHEAKYSTLRTEFQDPAKVSRYKFIDLNSLYYLVKDFNISADWLITGRGGMFK